MIEISAVHLVGVQIRIERFLNQFMKLIAVLLEVLLQELEQVQIFLVGHVEPIHVGVLEHLSALNDLYDGFLQEF